MRRNPDVDQPPIPSDEDEKPPAIVPPDQPGRREEDEPDPPPLGDPPNDEPTRILAGYKSDRPRARQLSQRAFRVSIVLVLSLAIGLGSYGAPNADEKKRKAPKGVPVLWKEPADIETRDLFLGSGGEALKPDLSKVTFQTEKKGGYSTKYEVIDGSGKKWIVKVGKEAQPEAVANRLLWAVGYFTEISYLAPAVDIAGRGHVTNARFEARPDQVKRLGEWKWDDNPFIGTPELQGLKVMMLLLNNWDIKDSNTNILLTTDGEGGQTELRYIISDLGGTFGKTGGVLTRSRNDYEDFVKATFIDHFEGDRVDFHYSGKRKDLFHKITTGQAAWIGRWLARLSDQQISDAFRAANYSPEQIEALTHATRARIVQLTALIKT
jgi:hypothetical protein